MSCRCPAPAALRRNMAPGHLFSMSRIHELAVVGVHVGRRPRAWNTFFMPAAVVVARRSFSGSAATFLVSALMATNMKGLGLVWKAFMSARSWGQEARSCCSLSAVGPGSPKKAVLKRLHFMLGSRAEPAAALCGDPCRRP